MDNKKWVGPKCFLDFLVKKRTKKKRDITSGMVRVIIICWLVPFLALSIVLFYYSEKATNTQVRENVTASLQNVAEMVGSNMYTVIKETNNASYSKDLRDCFKRLIKGESKIENNNDEYDEDRDDSDPVVGISRCISDLYQRSDVIQAAVVVMPEELVNEGKELEKNKYRIKDILASVESVNAARKRFHRIRIFEENGMVEKVREIASNLDTRYKIIVDNGNMYVVRNLMWTLSNKEKEDYPYGAFAILVTEIDTDYVFNSLNDIMWKKEAAIFLKDGRVNFGKVEEGDNPKFSSRAKKYKWTDTVVEAGDLVQNSGYDEGSAFAELDLKTANTQFLIDLQLDKSQIIDENSTVVYFYIIIIVLLIPLIYATVRYFYKNVSRPINMLVEASSKIEKGEYGYELEPYENNVEFSLLVDIFNKMSVSLKEAFKKIYVEEIAVRDANMQALQAQINPHFLNNTLEIINWKARMSGNDDVSGMIESLGIMMEATMNRKNESFITLEEEMKYVDAYLYIIDQRFGNRFQFTKEMDESLMNVKIPRLIIQPLVENAVEHGGDINGNRIGKLIVRSDEKYLYIVVENNGTITEEERKKIDKLLLATDYKTKAKNIGIRNVNMRIKMIYGNDSGLTIENSSDEDNKIISTIRIERDGQR